MSTVESTPSRSWGLTADSTRGLVGKILMLSVVAAIAVALAIPLVARQDWVWLGLKLGHELPVVADMDLNREPTREPVDSV